MDDHSEGKNKGKSRSKQKNKSRQSNIKGLKLSRRNKIESDDSHDSDNVECETGANQPVSFDEDCDISALEAPTFTTLDKAPSGPMLSLQWDHPVNLIGEKVVSPRIHICDLCDKPILLYGRMIPCKHVFCHTCAKAEDRCCSRCGDRVSRVEQTGLGTVHMCSFTTNDGACKRTYLSQRDLQAHIAHRHVKPTQPREESVEVSHRDPRGDTRSSNRPDPRSGVSIGDPRVGVKETFDNTPSYARTFSQPPPSNDVMVSSSVSHHIPVMTSSRANLITVPLQDQTESFVASPLTPSHPPPIGIPPNPFATPPPIVTYVPPSSSYGKIPPQYTFPTTAPPSLPPSHLPPYSSSLPPVPVPPPTTFGNHVPSQYDPQYTSQWNTPPPQPPVAPPRGPPPSHHPSLQPPYYR